MNSLTNGRRVADLIVKNGRRFNPTSTISCCQYFSNTSQNTETRKKKRRLYSNKKGKVSYSDDFQSERKSAKKNQPENMKKQQKERHFVDSTLAKCNDIMVKLLQRRKQIDAPPIEWILATESKVEIDDYEFRINLYKDIISLTKALELSIRSKRIQASSTRDIRELSALLGNILLICSESPPKRLAGIEELPSTSEMCKKVLSLLEELNLDIQNFHNFCTIRAANQEHQWKLASNLFLNQIDPDMFGLVPIDSKLGWDRYVEMGLYGLAMSIKQSKNTDIDVANGIFDAVSDMCMVSPTDREKYVLAAGSALGRAGEWKSCIEFLVSNPNSDFGHNLVAAVMDACFICGRYDDVLDVYYNVQTLSDASDWQWEGEYSRSHPLAIDLLLRSVGMKTILSEEGQGYSDAMILIFNQILEEGGRISLSAIKGVLQTCKNDADFGLALQVLKSLQKYTENREKCDWTIIPDEKSSFLESDHSNDNLVMLKGIDDDIIATVMETCCAAKEFGLALLCLRFAPVIGEEHLVNDLDLTSINTCGDMIPQLLDQQPPLLESERLLNATALALLGIGCPNEANQLNAICGKPYETSPNTNHSNVSWIEAYRHIDRLLLTLDDIASSRQKLRKIDEYYLSTGMALMMQNATDAGQVNAGLEVASIINSRIGNLKRPRKSVKDAMITFLGLDKEMNDQSNFDFYLSSDILFSIMIKAYGSKYGNMEAWSFYFDGIEALKKDGKFSGKVYIQSNNAALDILVKQGDVSKAFQLFEATDRQYRTPETYFTLAQGFVQTGQWNKVSSLYKLAKKDFLISEAMCYVTMKAISNSNIDNKVKLLRSIADDISAQKGIKSGTWIAENYWSIKENVGYHHARLLMWWNDPRETQQQEFRLAVQHLDKSERENKACHIEPLATIISLANDDTFIESNDQDISDLVTKALIRICGSGHELESSMLLQGLMYLSTNNAVECCMDFVNYYEKNEITVDDDIVFLARTTAKLSPPTDWE